MLSPFVRAIAAMHELHRQIQPGLRIERRSPGDLESGDRRCLFQERQDQGVYALVVDRAFLSEDQCSGYAFPDN